MARRENPRKKVQLGKLEQGSRGQKQRWAWNQRPRIDESGYGCKVALAFHIRKEVMVEGGPKKKLPQNSKSKRSRNRMERKRHVHMEPVQKLCWSNQRQ